MDVDLPLFLFTTVASMIGSFLHPVINYVLKIVFRENEQNTYIRKEIAEVKREMSSISMVDEFARHARLQRKLIKLQETLKQERGTLSSTKQKYKYMASCCLSLAMAAVMIPFIIMYRSKPVLILPTKWLHPLSSLMAWPSDDVGAVSVLCWSAVCNGVGRIISSRIPV